MSVILMHPVTRERILFSKGADSAMFPRIDAHRNADRVVMDKTKNQLNKYAELGLRVLVMAKKHLSDADYQEWLKDHVIAEVRRCRRMKILILT